MIQRIQTVFLLIALIAWTLLFFNPMFDFHSDAGAGWELHPGGIRELPGGETVLKAIPMLILFVLIELLAFLAVISFKRRALQLRITVLAMMLQILSYGIVALYVVLGRKQLDAEPGVLFSSVFPLISAVSSYLAFRGIRKDILLLRAFDRLR